jgi:hypothetical protein
MLAACIFASVDSAWFYSRLVHRREVRWHALDTLLGERAAGGLLHKSKHFEHGAMHQKYSTRPFHQLQTRPLLTLKYHYPSVTVNNMTMIYSHVNVQSIPLFGLSTSIVYILGDTAVFNRFQNTTYKKSVYRITENTQRVYTAPQSAVTSQHHPFDIRPAPTALNAPTDPAPLHDAAPSAKLVPTVSHDPNIPRVPFAGPTPPFTCDLANYAVIIQLFRRLSPSCLRACRFGSQLAPT